jgi:WD40 repeat protein
MPRKIPPGPDGNKNGPSIKLEHWPRLTTQRMQRRAHLFRGHSGPITALVCNDPSKFLSAGADGTVRIWSPSKGIEMFRMDGFSDSSCRSLCLDHDLLVTDGMEEYVCVHDFDVTDAEIEEGYKLEW